MSILYHRRENSQGAEPIGRSNPLPMEVVGAVHTGGGAFQSSASYTRPANTTAYTAKDAVSNATSSASPLEFRNVLGQDSVAGWITKILFLTSQATDTSRYRLHLYGGKPLAINDNAAMTAPLLIDSAVYLGKIDIGPVAAEGTGATAAYFQDETIRFRFVCPGGNTSLWGLLEVQDGPTPDSAQTYYVRLIGERD